MSISKAYDQWSASYNEMENKTRDLEAIAIRSMLNELSYENVLELGCGTGKNTIWLAERAGSVVAVDFSSEMMKQAGTMVRDENVKFIQADITADWNFITEAVDLVTTSLVLEHVAELQPIFQKASLALKPGGYFYIGELHPFKQYSGSKARFETGGGVEVLECFVHHLGDFFGAAKANGFAVLDIREWFDEDDRSSIPRLLCMLFQKQKS